MIASRIKVGSDGMESSSVSGYHKNEDDYAKPAEDLSGADDEDSLQADKARNYSTATDPSNANEVNACKKGSTDMEATLQRHVQSQQDVWEAQLQKKIKEGIYPGDFTVAYRLLMKAIQRVCCSPSISQEKVQPYKQALALLKGCYKSKDKSLLKVFELLGERRFKNILVAGAALKNEVIMRKSHGHGTEGTNSHSGQKRGREELDASTNSNSMSAQGSELNQTPTTGGRRSVVSEETVRNHCGNIARSAFTAGYQQAMRRLRQEMIQSDDGKYYLLERSLERTRSNINPSEELIEQYKIRGSTLFEHKPENGKENAKLGDQWFTARSEGDNSSTSFEHQFQDLELRFGVRF